MKKLIKYISVLTILIAGIFIVTQNNQTVEAQDQLEYCELWLPGWGDCDMTAANCICEIVVEGN